MDENMSENKGQPFVFNEVSEGVEELSTDNSTGSKRRNYKLSKRKLEKEIVESQRKKVLKSKQADKILSGKGRTKTERDVDEVVNLEKVLAEAKPELVSMNQLQIVAPKSISGKALHRATELINEYLTTTEDGVLSIHLRDNFVSWFKATNNVRGVSMQQYMDAVKFVTYKLSGDTNVRAYARTFPDRVKAMQDKQEPMHHLDSYASTYNKGQLVTEIMALSIVPAHIMYNDIFHRAVKTQAEIMTDDRVSPKVRSDAANSLLTHLKQPENKRVELDIGVKESQAITQLRDVLSSISENQHHQLKQGKLAITDVSKQQLYKPTGLDLSGEETIVEGEYERI